MAVFSPLGISGPVTNYSPLGIPSVKAHGFLSCSKDLEDKKMGFEGINSHCWITRKAEATGGGLNLVLLYCQAVLPVTSPDPSAWV